MTPVRAPDDESNDNMNDATTIAVREALNEKFRNLDSFLTKQLLKNIQDLSVDTRARL